jgi:hypothetical protein
MKKTNNNYNKAVIWKHSDLPISKCTLNSISNDILILNGKLFILSLSEAPLNTIDMMRPQETADKRQKAVLELGVWAWF